MLESFKLMDKLSFHVCNADYSFPSFISEKLLPQILENFKTSVKFSVILQNTSMLDFKH